MSTRIYTNVSSLIARIALLRTHSRLDKTIERLSTGLRINRAADDAAGLAISQNLRADIATIEQAVRNGNDGIGVIQTREGAMNEMHEILTRMRVLSEESANGTLDTSARTNLQAEFTQLMSEIDRIASVSEFNGLALGATASGPSAGNVSARLRFSFQIGFQNTVADIVAYVPRYYSAITTRAMNFTTVSATANIAISTQASARTALSMIDLAISSVSLERGTMGALANRMEKAINNLEVTLENLTAAESQIRDADFAAEMADFTKNQILAQSGAAMLAQANLIPQTVLQLLG